MMFLFWKSILFIKVFGLIMPHKTTYTKIAAKIIFITMLFTLIAAYFYGEYMKKDAISNLAHVDAKKDLKEKILFNGY